MTGDGYQNRTAWAGAGNGVLVLDLNGNGKIDRPTEFEFTAWDPTATSDMQALRDVFDTNHDGKLDAGDANFAAFKVMVTNADGDDHSANRWPISASPRSISPPTTPGRCWPTARSSRARPRSPGPTAPPGPRPTCRSPMTPTAMRSQQSITRNADGSTTIDVKAFNPDGSLANETVSTTSADGLSRVLKFDHSGNGIFDKTQTSVTSSMPTAAGPSRWPISTSPARSPTAPSPRPASTARRSRSRATSTAMAVIDQTELHVTNADGSKTITVSDLNGDGSLRDRTVSTTSQDGLTKLVQTNSTGAGRFDRISSDVTVVAADGSRIETVTDLNQNGSLRDSSVTATSADGRIKTIQSDLDGNGTIDLSTVAAIVVAADGSSVTTQTDRNADGSLRDQTVTSLSADGLSKTVSVDLDGNGSVRRRDIRRHGCECRRQQDRDRDRPQRRRLAARPVHHLARRRWPLAHGPGR